MVATGRYSRPGWFPTEMPENPSVIHNVIAPLLTVMVLVVFGFPFTDMYRPANAALSAPLTCTFLHFQTHRAERCPSRVWKIHSLQERLGQRRTDPLTDTACPMCRQ